MGSVDQVPVVLVGATGYTGVEALRLLHAHPGVRLAGLCADRRAGQPLADHLPAWTDIPLPPVERFDADSIDAVRGRLARHVRAMQHAIGEASDASEKLARLGLHRVLCAHRRGALGVEALCALLDEVAAAERRTSSRAGWFRGRLLLVTRNAPEQDLWNGDVGLVEETPTGLRALFPAPSGGVRSLAAGRLPAHESAIAMSVHKSQGSEFDEVDLVLGAKASPLMTRELLYTGVTRARERLRLHASEAVLRTAIARRIERDSALAARLRSAFP